MDKENIKITKTISVMGYKQADRPISLLGSGRNAADTLFYVLDQKGIKSHYITFWSIFVNLITIYLLPATSFA